MPQRLHDLKGYHIQARDGKIGKLEQLYFDDQAWTVRYLVVHTGNWLLGREVLIVPQQVLSINEDEKTLIVELTRKQVEHSPPVETTKLVSRYYEEEYHRYYGWEPYWLGDPLLGAQIPPVIDPIADETLEIKEPPDIHLRSSQTVTGYHIHAKDGEIGHLEDFILDEQAWKVRYLEIDTRNWWPGKKVLVMPSWIKSVDWVESEVSVNLTCEAIQGAPEYDPSQTITKDYELRLFEYYSQFLNQCH